MNNIPQVGDKLYIPTQLHVYRGEDDVHGGLATISKVIVNPNLPEDHYNKIFVKFEELNRAESYNYKYLLEKQEELKLVFGDTVCYPYPDYSTEFNCPNADWH